MASRFDAADAYVSQWFAEQGFAVLVAEAAGRRAAAPPGSGRSTWTSPGRCWKTRSRRSRRRPRCGLSSTARRWRSGGWSFGGFLAALAVLRRPDVFHAAVAGAPVTDHRLYDTHWRERHLGHPDEHPEAYERSSLIGDAPSLIRPLLLVHGLADDNVVAAHTLRLSAALLAAGQASGTAAAGGDPQRLGPDSGREPALASAWLPQAGAEPPGSWPAAGLIRSAGRSEGRPLAILQAAQRDGQSDSRAARRTADSRTPAREVEGAHPRVHALLGSGDGLQHGAQRADGLLAVRAGQLALVVAVEAPRGARACSPRAESLTSLALRSAGSGSRST